MERRTNACFCILFVLTGMLMVAPVSSIGQNQQTPTNTALPVLTWRSDLSGSYVTARSWLDEPASHILLRLFSEARWVKKKGGGRRSDHLFTTRLGYTSYTDSVWRKSSDQFRLRLHWTGNGARQIRRSCTVQLRSQWLTTWKFDDGSRHWNAGFMNPLLFDAAYGFHVPLMKNSYFTFEPASLRVNVYPTTLPAAAVDQNLFRTRHSSVASGYGFSGGLLIDEFYYNGHLQWQQQARFFCNAFGPDRIRFDLTNRLCVRFLRHMQLKLETVLTYEPEYTYRIQYRQELLLGIFHEYRK